jgi:hypothetical protein
MKGGQSKEVGSKESHPGGGGGGTKRGKCKGRLIRFCFGEAEMFANKVRWVAEKKFYGEAADFDVSAADGVKEGGVRRGAESTRDVVSEGSVFEVWGRWG